jgi:hypothetical protein
MNALPPLLSAASNLVSSPPYKRTVRRVNSTKTASARSIDYLGNTFRTGLRTIPIVIRKIKNGISVFLNKLFPMEPLIEMAARRYLLCAACIPIMFLRFFL